MQLLSEFQNLATSFHRYRQRVRTERLIASLPETVRKDIGWPDSRLRQRPRNLPDGVC